MIDEQRAFWSKVAPQYDRVVDLQIGPATRGMERDRQVREQTLGDVVELGCGTGFYTQVLAERAARVVATDCSPGMLALAQELITAGNVRFQVEDCQRTSLPDGAFDTVFMSLVIHFTEPALTVAEVRRLLKPGGRLIIANLDPQALGGLDRVRCLARIVYHGLTGYRTKPPKASLNDALTERQLRDLLTGAGFEVASSERLQDPSRSSNIPVEYVRAGKPVQH